MYYIVYILCGSVYPIFYTVIECPELSTIDNGRISYSPDTTANFDQGTVATYTCDDRFSLVGNRERTCQADGTFSGTDPFCSFIRECLSQHTHAPLT